MSHYQCTAAAMLGRGPHCHIFVAHPILLIGCSPPSAPWQPLSGLLPLRAWPTWSACGNMGPDTSNNKKGIFWKRGNLNPARDCFLPASHCRRFLLFFKPRTFAFDLSSLSKSKPRVLSTSSSDATACKDHFIFVTSNTVLIPSIKRRNKI